MYTERQEEKCRQEWTGPVCHKEQHAETECRWFKGIDGGTYPVIRKGVRYTDGLSGAQSLSLTFSDGLYSSNPRK